MKTIKRRVDELKKKIDSKEENGIHCYEDWIRAVHSGQEINYNSTPYLRRLLDSWK